MHESLHSALAHYFSADEIRQLSVSMISGEASSRRYVRIGHENWQNTRILCLDPAFMQDGASEYPFITVQRLLSQNGVSVPLIYDFDRATGSLLLEDCGSVMLQEEASRSTRERLRELYMDAIDQMTTIQSITGNLSEIPFDRSFDTTKLLQELDFFIHHALEPAQQPTLAAIRELRAEFRVIAARLDKPEHFVLSHRDYHSRNIMMQQQRPVVIDFQDARLGLPQYDAASLLRDAYQPLDDNLVEELLNYHHSRISNLRLCRMGYAEYRELFDIMAFQRTVKALGTFYHQSKVLGKPGFSRYIAPASSYLTGYASRQPSLRRPVAIISALLTGQST